MSYSVDLRVQAVKFVAEGGRQIEASRVFGVSRKTIYNWLSSDDLTPHPSKSRQGKLDTSKLVAHVREHPDALLRERAATFKVTPSGMWRALRRLGMRKKNDALC